MKKVNDNNEMRSEYKREDLGVGVRGKYYESYNESNNIVLLSPEVARAFPTEESVNSALLSLIKLANASINPTRLDSCSRLWNCFKPDKWGHNVASLVKKYSSMIR